MEETQTSEITEEISFKEEIHLQPERPSEEVEIPAPTDVTEIEYRETVKVLKPDVKETSPEEEEAVDIQPQEMETVAPVDITVVEYRDTIEVELKEALVEEEEEKPSEETTDISVETPAEVEETISVQEQEVPVAEEITEEIHPEETEIITPVVAEEVEETTEIQKDETVVTEKPTEEIPEETFKEEITIVPKTEQPQEMEEISVEIYR